MAKIGTHVEPDPEDLTPVSGGATDVAPLGRDVPKPAHERTADEDINAADWNQIAAMDEFRSLIAEKVRFIAPATIFFLVYYLALPILVGYAPDLMNTKIIGPVNLAYIFALSQFFMAWILAFLYLRRARHFDILSKNMLAKWNGLRGGNR